MSLRIKIAVLLICFVVPSLTGAEPSFVKLFDGKTLKSWTLVGSHGLGYVVKDGMIACPKEGGGNLFTEKEYANFAFRFEFRNEPTGNNGVGIRAPLKGDAAYVGMEIKILDDAPEYEGKLRPAQYHGSVYDVIPAQRGYLKKAGEWNEEEIRAEGRRLKVTLNGTVILDADLDPVRGTEDASWPGTPCGAHRISRSRLSRRVPQHPRERTALAAC